MSQLLLLLAVLAVLGLYGVRWTGRLAPLTSELPLKTLLATALCALTVGLGLGGGPVSPALYALAIALGSLFILAPFVLSALARWRLYRAAAVLADLLYWTQAGRAGIRRLLAQVALQQADGERALELLPEGGDLLRAQAYALLGRWREVLTLDLPEQGEDAFLGSAARAEALLELGDEAAAEAELRAMERRWQAQGQGPLGYRSIKLTQARLHAHRGDLGAARRELGTPLPGLPPYRVLETLALAAERAGDAQAASQLYAQAYAYAPPGRKARLGEALGRYGKTPAETPRPRVSVATFALSAALVALYGVQLWVNARYGDRAWALVAGFLTLPSDAPGAAAPWRYLSYAYVHGGPLHIGLNTWVLVDIGRLYEARRPWGSLLTAFVFGTAMGAYLTLVAQGGGPPGVVGASGGVLGVAGALLADTLRGRGPRDRLLTRSLLQWVGFIVIFSLAIPNVSLWGHVGGLVGGLLWGFVRQGLPATRRLDLAAGIVSLLLLGYALLGALRWLMQYAPQL